ncbi:MAG: ABC transporter permease [Candidatus Micrarchaeaceae archaeon]
MSMLGDSLTMLKRELMIFRSNFTQNIIRSIMFPLLLLLIFSGLGNGVSNVPVAIVNYANNQQSLQFINKLELQNMISVMAVTGQANAFNMFRDGKVDMVIVILPQFPNMRLNNPSVDIYYTNSQLSSLGALPFIESTAESFGSSVQSLKEAQAAIAASGSSAGATNNILGVSGSDPVGNAASSSVSAIPSFAAEGNYTTFLVAGIIIMVAAFGAMFSGGMSIITDRIAGNLKLFLIAPINRLAIVVGKILSGSVQVMLTVVLTIIIGLLFGAQIAMGWYGLMWIFLLAFIAAIGMGGLAAALAARIKRFEVYAIATQSITLPLWFVAGAFFPASELPSWLYPLSVVDPFTYAIQGMRYVMMSGFYPTSAMTLDLGVTLAFAVAMVLLAVKMFKTTIE